MTLMRTLLGVAVCRASYEMALLLVANEGDMHQGRVWRHMSVRLKYKQIQAAAYCELVLKDGGYLHLDGVLGMPATMVECKNDWAQLSLLRASGFNPGSWLQPQDVARDQLRRR